MGQVKFIHDSILYTAFKLPHLLQTPFKLPHLPQKSRAQAWESFGLHNEINMYNSGVMWIGLDGAGLQAGCCIDHLMVLISVVIMWYWVSLYIFQH